MEYFIGGAILLVLVVFLYFFCKNVTFTVKIEYPEVHETPVDVEKLQKEFDESQERTEEILEVLSSINSFMLDEEDK